MGYPPARARAIAAIDYGYLDVLCTACDRTGPGLVQNGGVRAFENDFTLTRKRAPCFFSAISGHKRIAALTRVQQSLRYAIQIGLICVLKSGGRPPSAAHFYAGRMGYKHDKPFTNLPGLSSAR